VTGERPGRSHRDRPGRSPRQFPRTGRAAPQVSGGKRPFFCLV